MLRGAHPGVTERNRMRSNRTCLCLPLCKNRIRFWLLSTVWPTPCPLARARH